MTQQPSNPDTGSLNIRTNKKPTRRKDTSSKIVMAVLLGVSLLAVLLAGVLYVSGSGKEPDVEVAAATPAAVAPTAVAPTAVAPAAVLGFGGDPATPPTHLDYLDVLTDFEEGIRPQRVLRLDAMTAEERAEDTWYFIWQLGDVYDYARSGASDWQLVDNALLADSLQKSMLKRAVMLMKVEAPEKYQRVLDRANAIHAAKDPNRLPTQKDLDNMTLEELEALERRWNGIQSRIRMENNR